MKIFGLIFLCFLCYSMGYAQVPKTTISQEASINFYVNRVKSELYKLFGDEQNNFSGLVREFNELTNERNRLNSMVYVDDAKRIHELNMNQRKLVETTENMLKSYKKIVEASEMIVKNTKKLKP